MKPPDVFLLQLAKPAQRALASAGITSVEQLATHSEQEIALMHGIGPSALRQIRQAFKEKGLSFTKNK